MTQHPSRDYPSARKHLATASRPPRPRAAQARAIPAPRPTLWLAFGFALMLSALWLTVLGGFWLTRVIL